MATTIAKLNTQLTLNTTGFTRGLKRARNATIAFGKSIAEVGLRLTKFGTAAAAGAAAGLSVMTKRGLENVDALAKTADKLGLTTESLQALQLAAERSGVSAQTMNMALQRMTRRVSEAGLGTGEAVKAIKEFGLNAQAIAALSPDQQLKVFADAMGTVENQADKVRLAMKLFDSEGVALVNTLAAGSEGLLQAEADMARFGAVTREQAAQVEAANDALTNIQAVLTAVSNQLAVEMAPWIETVNKGMLEWATTGEGMAAKVSAAVEWVAKSVAQLADWIQWPIFAFHALRSGATTALAHIMHNINTVGKGLNWLANLIPGVTVEFQGMFASIEKGLRELADEQMGQAADALKRFREGARQQQVTEFFQDVRDRSRENAAAVAARAPGAAPPGAPATAASGTRSAQQVVLSRVAVGGSADQRSAADRELPRQTMLLEQLLAALNRGVPAVSAAAPSV